MAIKNPEKEGSIIIRKVPDSVRRAFKARCAKEGVSQQDKIVDLMREWAGGDG